MAVNASPMYAKAEERYRAAHQPAEKIAALEEMLRLVPKHKASEKLQAQLKEKLKRAREELQKGHAKGSGHGPGDLFHVPRQGAGQVVLLGAPNVGKSSIVGALTAAKVEIADFPYSTHAAVPGMAHHEDVPIQLVDMPPIMEGHAQRGMMNAYRGADAILMVVDLSAIELIDQYEQCIRLLGEHSIRCVSTPTLEFDEDESAAIPKRVLVAANKSDTAGAKDNFDGFQELVGGDLRMIPVSAKSGDGLTAMMAELFALLNVIRIYAKKPGKPVDKLSPFILPAGATVQDMAHLVHRELAEKLSSARIWGGTVHDGQQVHATHVLTDKNVVELHF
jgi:ribosome-interacting GTPase 1